MEIGRRYIVTKASDDGMFRVGDHIVLCRDGVIECREQGWLSADEVAAATKGMEYEIDQEWIARQRARLLAELAALDG